MENTTNLKLPLLIPNQSGKEITHNEALVIIDNILQNGIIDKDLTTPPENPNINDMYIVGEWAIGKWEGKDNYLAFYDNGWRFIEPREGFTFWVNDEDKLYTYNGSKWIATIQVGADIENNNSTTPTTPPITKLSELEDVEIIEATQYNILQHNGEKFINTSNLQQLSMVGINTQADENNKLSIKSDYVLFDNNGNSSKIKANKATETDTASHLFQNNYSGRAEFGLIGDDDFTLKVSNNGETWKDAFVVDKATGNIDFKANITQNGQNIDTIKKVQTITLNGENEIEFTGLNDGYQHYFEFLNLKPSTASYMLCLLGNSTSYMSSGYSYALFYMDDNVVTNWAGNGASGHNVSAIKITLDKYSAWYLNPDIGGYANFKILSDLSQNGVQYFEGKSIVADSTTPPYMIMGLQHGMLVGGTNLDRIKFYLSSGNFASGTIKHYIIK